MTKAAAFSVTVFLLFIITASLHCHSVGPVQELDPPLALPRAEQVRDGNSTENYLTQALQQALKNLIKKEFNCSHVENMISSESVEEGRTSYYRREFKCEQTNIQIYAVLYALFAVAITAVWTTASFLVILLFIKLYEVYRHRCRCNGMLPNVSNELEPTRPSVIVSSIPPKPILNKDPINKVKPVDFTLTPVE